MALLWSCYILPIFLQEKLYMKIALNFYEQEVANFALQKIFKEGIIVVSVLLY